MNKKFKWLLALVLFTCSLPLLVWGLDAWHYAGSDNIQRAGIDTERILSSYEQTKDAAEIRNWLINGPNNDGSLVMQVNLTFGLWALHHKDDFVRIVEGLPEKEQNHIAKTFLGSLGQGGMDTEFCKEFKGYKSKVIKSMFPHQC